MQVMGASANFDEHCIFPCVITRASVNNVCVCRRCVVLVSLLKNDLPNQSNFASYAPAICNVHGILYTCTCSTKVVQGILPFTNVWYVQVPLQQYAAFYEHNS